MKYKKWCVCLICLFICIPTVGALTPSPNNVGESINGLSIMFTFLLTFCTFASALLAMQLAKASRWKCVVLLTSMVQLVLMTAAISVFWNDVEAELSNLKQYLPMNMTVALSKGEPYICYTVSNCTCVEFAEMDGIGCNQMIHPPILYSDSSDSAPRNLFAPNTSNTSNDSFYSSCAGGYRCCNFLTGEACEKQCLQTVHPSSCAQQCGDGGTSAAGVCFQEVLNQTCTLNVETCLLTTQTAQMHSADYNFSLVLSSQTCVGGSDETNETNGSDGRSETSCPILLYDLNHTLEVFYNPNAPDAIRMTLPMNWAGLGFAVGVLVGTFVYLIMLIFLLFHLWYKSDR